LEIHDGDLFSIKKLFYDGFFEAKMAGGRDVGFAGDNKVNNLRKSPTHSPAVT